MKTDHLTVDDLKDVRTAIWDARSGWKDIGIELGLKITHLDAIEENNHGNAEKCFTKMLTVWLKRVNPPPTWSAMVEALKGRTVDFEDLAEQVENKFLVDEPKRKIRRIDSDPAIRTTMSCEYMVAALKEPAVGFEDLAEEVDSKYVHQSSKSSDTTDTGSATGTIGEYCS